MAPDEQFGRVSDKPEGDGGLARRPKKLISTVAPGDIEAPTKTTATSTTSTTTDPSDPSTKSALPTANPALALHAHVDGTMTPTSAIESEIIAHPARAHQFVSNPPLTISQIHPTNPLRQFHSWFRDPRLLPSSAPETCILATASMPSGRVSARAVYLKELDERGWVVYSNWGSREGKGGQVFGQYADGSGSGSTNQTARQTRGSGMDGLGAMPSPEEAAATGITGGGNKWAALTFSWATVERQVRIEGLLEPLSRAESELYWRTRERGSQIGAWASWQSKVLWSAEPGSLVNAPAQTWSSGANNTPQAPSNAAGCGEVPGDIDETDMDDGRALLEQRVKEMEERFANVQEIPLPPFWGGVRLVPESVEFWQGRRSRLHDRFRYVRVEEGKGGDGTVPRQNKEQEAVFQWRIERLSP